MMPNDRASLTAVSLGPQTIPADGHGPTVQDLGC